MMYQVEFLVFVRELQWLSNSVSHFQNEFNQIHETFLSAVLGRNKIYLHYSLQYIKGTVSVSSLNFGVEISDKPSLTGMYVIDHKKRTFMAFLALQLT